jgi:predicted negative regulator of RcsB-dependent stress response
LVYVKQEEYNKALSEYNIIINSFPETGLTYRHRGDLYLLQGKQSLACTDWEKAKKLGVNGMDAVIKKNCDNE